MPTPKASSKEELVSFMAKQLLQGSSMIAESCPECGTPLLRQKDGTIFCAKCQRQVIIVDSEKAVESNATANLDESKMSSAPSTEHKTSTAVTHTTSRVATVVLSRLEDVLLEKIRVITEALQGITDPKSYRDLLGTTEELLKVYQQTRVAHATDQTKR